MVCVNELISNLDSYIPIKSIMVLKKIILKEFIKKTQFIENCFLISSDFESEDIIGYLPTV